MFDKPHAKRSLGIEWDGLLMKSAELSFVKGKAVVGNTYALSADLEAPAHVNLFDITAEGRQLYKAIQHDLVVSTLESDEVLIRSLDIKLKKERDIDSVLAFQAEPLLPYPIESAILDRMTVSQTAEGSQIALIAARKDHVQQHLERLAALNINPDVVSCVPVALAFFSKFALTTPDHHFVLHLGQGKTTCALVKEGKLLAAQAGSFGLDRFVKNLPKGIEIDFKNLSEKEYPALYESLEAWRREITRLLYALSKHAREHEINELLITGEGAIVNGLGEGLCKDLHKHFLIPDEAAANLPASQLQRYAVPIGAALSALENVKDQINFRQHEYAHPNPWKHLKQPIALYFLLCLGLAGAFYLFGNANINLQKETLRQEYIDLLATMNKSYASFEKEYAAKLPEQNAEPVPVDQLSPQGIGERLHVLHKEIKDSPDTFPLFPNTPRVSDLLAWLSTHPSVAGSGKEGGSQLLQIESLNYTMIKRPELKKQQEKYQVKVELEFSAATPKHAREFHDALIAPNDFVDPKGEVKWSSNRGKYRASFFLKDRTAYPSTAGQGG